MIKKRKKTDSLHCDIIFFLRILCKQGCAKDILLGHIVVSMQNP